MLLGIVEAPIRAIGGDTQRVLATDGLYKTLIYESLGTDTALCRKFVHIGNSTLALGVRIFSCYSDMEDVVFKRGITEARKALGLLPKNYQGKLEFYKELYYYRLLNELYCIDRYIYEYITMTDNPDYQIVVRDALLDNDDGIAFTDPKKDAAYIAEIFDTAPPGTADWMLGESYGLRLGDYKKYAYDLVTDSHRHDPTIKPCSMSIGRCCMKELIYPQGVRLSAPVTPVAYTNEVQEGLRKLIGFRTEAILHLCFTNILSQWKYDTNQSYYVDFRGVKPVDTNMADKLLAVEGLLLSDYRGDLTGKTLKMYYTTNDEVVIDILDERSNVVKEFIFDMTISTILTSSLVDTRTLEGDINE